jgi:TonB family protein
VLNVVSKLKACGWIVLLCGALANQVPGQESNTTATESRYQAAYRSYLQHVEREDFKAALPYAQEAYLLGKSIFGEDSENFANLTYNYGLTLLEIGASARAYPVLQDALAKYEDLFGKEAFRLSTLLAHLATAAANNDNRKLAQMHFDRGLAIVARHRGENSLAVATFALHAGIALAENANPQAERYLRSSYTAHRNTAGEDDRGTALAALYLGQLSLDQQHFSAAIAYLKAALKGFETGIQADRQYALAAHTGLVIAYESLGRSEAATDHCLAIGARFPEVYEDGIHPLYQPEPDYPAAALQAGSQGSVTIEFDVDERGFVREVKAIDVKGGEVFVEPALEAARRYRFAPRFMNGQPISQEKVRALLSFTPPVSGDDSTAGSRAE